ncbi:Uncharacterized protein E3U43_019868 [Larimichthys crocea]|uniref:Uncharacterized protein n=1 Tax=Larimichthys crocea TaxID=215358 RepID=A0ACD3QUR0_LARCR|nr:Uncharacterized protein E3U43_019868 [Larimichthys crocea]
MTQPRHVSVPPSQTDSSRAGTRMMNDHPWKPLTLAAYPRPEGSRSNYGAVERILKNYESAARAQQNQSQQDGVSSSPNISIRQEETGHRTGHAGHGPPSLTSHSETHTDFTHLTDAQHTRTAQQPQCHECERVASNSAGERRRVVRLIFLPPEELLEACPSSQPTPPLPVGQPLPHFLSLHLLLSLYHPSRTSILPTPQTHFLLHLLSRLSHRDCHHLISTSLCD